MGEGLLGIGLTTLDMVARPIDALPTGEGARLIEGIAVAPAEIMTKFRSYGQKA